MYENFAVVIYACCLSVAIFLLKCSFVVIPVKKNFIQRANVCDDNLLVFLFLFIVEFNNLFDLHFKFDSIMWLINFLVKLKFLFNTIYILCMMRAIFFNKFICQFCCWCSNRGFWFNSGFLTLMCVYHFNVYHTHLHVIVFYFLFCYLS